MRKLFFISLFFITPFLLKAQTGFVRLDTIRVFDTNNVQLKNPWAGGHNFVQMSVTDLNFDGIKDLVVFDRTSSQYDKITTYINIGTPNQVAYVHAPQYEKKFPHVHDWFFLVDYDCDGKEDILTYNTGDISAYKNTSSSGNLQFTLEYPDIYSTYYSNTYIHLYVSPVDLPAFVDMDHDGDLDMLCYQLSGTQVEYHRNFAMENFSRCDTMVFKQECTCWGLFTESTSTNTINIHTCNPATACPGPDQNYDSTNVQRYVHDVSPQHSGNCIACMDLDGDGDMDMINGGVSFCNLNQMTNGGTSTSANVTVVDPNYPSSNVSVNQYVWACPFHLDVNNDGKRDLIVSPNSPNVSENARSIQYYMNTGTDAAPNFIFQQNNLLQDNEIDIGEGAYPAFLDVDADGLTDIIVGQYSLLRGPGCIGGTKTTSLTVYRNIGTISHPKFKFLTSDYAGLKTLLAGENNLMPTFGDLDNDGDLDMIVGDENGKMHELINTAGVGNPPVFAAPSPYFLLDYSSATIDVGNAAAPQLFDLDGDHLLDLVVGQQAGKLFYFKNIGTANSPSFKLITDSLGRVDMQPTQCCGGYSTPFIFKDSGITKMFVGSEQGVLYHYTNIDNNLTGTFTKTDSLFGRPNEIWEGGRIAVTCKDITNDGLMDMVVGNYRGGLAYYQGDLTVGVHEYEADASVEIFPNPANSTINFKLTNMDPRNVELDLYNLLGEQMLSKKVSGLTGSVDVSSLANGIYICKIISGNKQCVKKVVIRK